MKNSLNRNNGNAGVFIYLVIIPIIIVTILTFACASIAIDNFRYAYLLIIIGPLIGMIRSLESLRIFCQKNVDTNLISENDLEMLQPESYWSFFYLYFKKGWPVYISLYLLFLIPIIIYMAKPS